MDVDLSDVEALRAIANGDRRALESLYHRHRRALWSFIRNYVADAHLADEVLQDTLVAVWKAAPSFRGDSRVTTWMFGIARRQAYNHLRRRHPEPVDTDALAPRTDSSPGPERVVVARDERDKVVDQIERLSPEHREALVLALAGDLSYGELSEMLGVPVGTVKSRVSNARRTLKSRLRGEEVMP